ncbi:TonB-dependent receptor, partial [Klebsiella pneumoniae]|nr:TonB-dependent receptor [Klebsiella pneumoniae]
LLDRVTATTQFCAGEAGQASVFGFTGTCRPAGKWKSWTPRVTVDYKPTPDTLVYATYAQGVKPGGFNGTGGLTALALTGQDL